MHQPGGSRQSSGRDQRLHSLIHGYWNYGPRPTRLTHVSQLSCRQESRLKSSSRKFPCRANRVLVLSVPYPTCAQYVLTLNQGHPLAGADPMLLPHEQQFIHSYDSNIRNLQLASEGFHSTFTVSLEHGNQRPIILVFEHRNLESCMQSFNSTPET